MAMIGNGWKGWVEWMVGMKWFEKFPIGAQMCLTLKVQVQVGQLLLAPAGVEGSARLTVDG